jgi:hypothetical protein
MNIITENQRIETPSAMKQVSLLLGEQFYTLLLELPDEFYFLDNETKARMWQKILHMINAGCYDPMNLAHEISIRPTEIK